MKKIKILQWHGFVILYNPIHDLLIWLKFGTNEGIMKKCKWIVEMIQYKDAILPVKEIPLWRLYKTVLRPSYLLNGISYTGKMTSVY